MENLEIKVNESYPDKLLQEKGFTMVTQYKDASRVYLNHNVGFYAQEYCGEYIIKHIFKYSPIDIKK